MSVQHKWGAGVNAFVDVWFESRVCENLNTTFPCGKEDLLSTPAERDLVGLNRLLVRGNWVWLGGREYEDVIGLCVSALCHSTHPNLQAPSSWSSLMRLTYLVTNDEAFSIRGPNQSERLSKTFDFIDDSFGLNIPELYNTITMKGS